MKEVPLIPLYHLQIGQTGTVAVMPPDNELKRRLTALGMIPGTPVTAVNQSASGDPKAYFFRAFLIALRHQEAQTVLVREDAGSCAGGNPLFENKGFSPRPPS